MFETFYEPSLCKKVDVRKEALWRPAWATRPEIPPPPKKKSRFWGNSQSGWIGPEVGFPLYLYMKPTSGPTFGPTLRTPPKPTFELLFGYYIFWGISGLVAHAGRHKGSTSSSYDFWRLVPRECSYASTNFSHRKSSADPWIPMPREWTPDHPLHRGCGAAESPAR